MKGSEIVAIAKKEIGEAEKPANSNLSKYGKWFGFDGVAWCGMFVSWCYAQAQVPLGKIGFLKGFAGCQTAVKHFTDTKQLTNNPEAGDIVFFDWNKDGRYDHTGIFVRQMNETTFLSIEGNTSLTNQSNGGTVMERVRKYKDAIFVHPKVLEDLDS